jgi:penicillin-binding protein 1A
MRRVLRGLSAGLLCGVVMPLATATTVLAALILLPLPAALPVAKPGVLARVTHVYDVNGHELATFHTFEQRVPVHQRDIPRVLKQAVVASEDKRFYSHGGVDVAGSLRALWADLRSERYLQGGSTITQQYVKNTYLDTDRTLTRKVREAILANHLDRQIRKDDILFRYLSSIYLGAGNYGVGAAAQSYFRKPVSQLSLSEAALVAGIIPAPSTYEPRANPARAEARRLVVLHEMLDQHRITPNQYLEAAAEKVFLCCGFGPPLRPATVVYPPASVPAEFPYFVDYVRRYVIARYGDEAFYKGGLRIQTTLDPVVQLKAEASVTNALAGTQAPLDMALVAVEPPTGFVKALVGGRDFGATRGQVNLALGHCPPAARTPDGRPLPPPLDQPLCLDGGGSGRQPGSAFKAFTLAKAFERGIPPERVYAAPTVYQVPGCRGRADCFIHNVEGEGGAPETLRTATWHSVNTVFAQVIRDAGIADTAELAHRLGVTAVDPTGRSAQGFPYGPQLTLGTVDVSVLDMAGAYAVFADRGLQQAPTPVARIEDASGRVLEDNTGRKAHRVLDEAVADNVTDVLRGVLTSGTARGKEIGRPAAGKTGTTDNNTNAWFVGYTPTLATAVWMGYADSAQRPLYDIKGVARVYGGTIPAQTWHDFMTAALSDVPVSEFSQPAPIKPIRNELNGPVAAPGLAPGDRRYPEDTPTGGPYEFGFDVAPPPVFPPPLIATTTTAPPVSTTTSTTAARHKPH